ncbi:MAG TPA: hypothetical protein DCQ32_03940 [Cyanobacteria bacterium UBA8156]|nr:hypothetical protein [Cyanobacteria bacterium UBA8156]
MDTLGQFRSRYPGGSIQTEILPKVDGLHVVRATVSDGDRPLSTALGTDSHLEAAEDRAVERALRFVGVGSNIEAIGTATLTPSYSRPALPESYTPLPLSELLTPPVEAKPEAKPVKKAPPALPEEPLDLSDIISQTDVEMLRLGWDARQGKAYLKQAFNKESRQHLTVAELQQFLAYLQQQPARPDF